VLLVNLLAALNFANVFLNKKNVWKIKETLKNFKKHDQNKKGKKFFLHLWNIPRQPKLFGRWQQRCDLSLSVLQPVVL